MTGLPSAAYAELGGRQICRILIGMWQLSGAHGFKPSLQPALDHMKAHVAAGFTTFDLADHYGPAEDFVGAFRRQIPEELTDTVQFFTKWVPRPGPMTLDVRAVAEGSFKTSALNDVFRWSPVRWIYH
jgi:aryl-alcohol dehydrogenase-like predicted oxidoreductase